MKTRVAGGGGLGVDAEDRGQCLLLQELTVEVERRQDGPVEGLEVARRPFDAFADGAQFAHAPSSASCEAILRKGCR